MEMREERTRLRGAVARGDGKSLVGMLRDGAWSDHALQLIGDGLIGALDGRVDGADDLSRTCVAALRQRDWDGDAELADSLGARLGSGPAPLLRPLQVDLEELALVREETRRAAVDLSTYAPETSGRNGRSRTPGTRSMTTTTRSDGCGSKAGARGPATTTWRCSSPPSRTGIRRTG